MQSRLRGRGALTALATGALALAGATAHAAEGPTRGHFGINSSGVNIQVGFGDRAPVRYDRGHDYAGTLRVNGRVCRVNLGDVCGSITTHFRRAGFRATHRDGSVYVRYRGCRPRVSWSSACYSARISYRSDCIVIRPYQSRRQYDRHDHYDRPGYSPAPRHHRYTPPRYAPRYTPRYTPRYYPRDRYRRYPAPGCGW